MKGITSPAHAFPMELRVHGVERAFDLLEALDRIGRPLTLTEISRKLRIPKSSAYYLIQTLIVRGYMRRVPGSRQYGSGLRIFDFHGLSSLKGELKHVCAQYIRGLSSALRMTVQVAVLEAGEGVIIDKADWPIDVWGGSWVGRHFDLHCTAQGKALIAWLTGEEIDRLFLNPKLARFTSRTITTLDKLKEHLAEVRKQGFALNDEEHILGIRALAAPVFNHLGSVAASVSMRGSTNEISNERIETLVSEIARTTALISRDLQNPTTC